MCSCVEDVQICFALLSSIPKVKRYFLVGFICAYFSWEIG